MANKGEDNDGDVVEAQASLTTTTPATATTPGNILNVSSSSPTGPMLGGVELVYFLSRVGLDLSPF